LLICLLLGLSGCAPHGNTDPIYVGHLAPLSGPDRAVGEQARKSIQLFVNEVMAGDKKVAGRPITVLHVDSRNDDETVRAETVRLVTVNKVVALIGSLDAALAERLVGEAQSLEIPVVVTGEFTGPSRVEGSLALGVSASRRGQALAQWLLAQKQTPLAAAGDSRSSLAGELTSAFVRTVRKENGTVRDWTFDGGAEKTDWLEEVVREKPAAVLLACAPPVFRRLSTALRKQGFKGTLIYGGEDVGPGPLHQDGEQDVLLATVCCAEGLTPQGQEVASKFKHAFQETPGYPAFQAYDAVRLLVDSMQETKPTTSIRLRDRLQKLESFDSLMGPITFKEQRTIRPLFLLRLEGRKSKLLKTEASEAE
jgi:branched-chain amino acid transport system substrate-binding protein